MITRCFNRLVDHRVPTAVGILIATLILLVIYGRTYCQVGTSYGAVPRIERFRGLVTLVKSKPETKSVKKTILYWTKMFSSKNFYFGEGNVFAGCPVWSCVGTNDRGYQRVEDFDAVMFHGPELDPGDLPGKRSPGQRYIFVDSETHVFHPIPDAPVFANFFNWTMAYLRDADVMRPYGLFENATSGEIIPPQIPAQWINVTDSPVPDSARLAFRNKTKTAAWFVSHCKTQSRREEVVKKLRYHMGVDVYGKCGDLKCPRTLGEGCYEKVESEYFFYLSLENSFCRDYLTEKIFKILEYNVVPVVYGAADYGGFLPPNSYIDIRDFASVEDLAVFLLELTHDEERYLGYFKWKNFYKLGNPDRYILCEFCKALHESSRPNQVIENMYELWINMSGCSSPPKIS